MTDTPGELAREAEISRARLDLTIDRLERRLAPLGLADEAVGLVRRSASLPVVEKGLEAARHNPLPVLLIAAGAGLLAWRLMGERDAQHHPSNGVSSNGFDASNHPEEHKAAREGELK